MSFFILSDFFFVFFLVFVCHSVLMCFELFLSFSTGFIFSKGFEVRGHNGALFRFSNLFWWFQMFLMVFPVVTQDF